MTTNSNNPQTLKSSSYEQLWFCLKKKSIFFPEPRIKNFLLKYEISNEKLKTNFVSLNDYLPNQLKINISNILSPLKILSLKSTRDPIYTERFDEGSNLRLNEIIAVENFEIHPLEETLKLNDKLCDDIAFKHASLSWMDLGIEKILIKGILFRNLHVSNIPSISGVIIQIFSNSEHIFNNIFPLIDTENNIFYDDIYTNTVYSKEKYDPLDYGIGDTHYYIENNSIHKYYFSSRGCYSALFIKKSNSKFINIEKCQLIKKLLNIETFFDKIFV